MIKKLPFEGILLVSDMDKTLITEKFEVPQRNIEAINRFIEKGGRFSLATGRAASSAAKYLSKVKTNAPSILSNGASIYDFNTKKLLWNTHLPQSAEELLRVLLKKFPDIGVEVYHDEGIYIVRNSQWTQRHIINEGFDYTITDIENVPHDWQKILLAGDNARLHEVDNYISSINHDGFYFVFSNTMYYEALPADVSKGTTLHRLAGILNISPEKTVGIGDYYNDIELVKMAGFGVTVEGAPKELLDIAKFVTGPCQKGAVADLIEYFEKSPDLFNQ